MARLRCAASESHSYVRLLTRQRLISRVRYVTMIRIALHINRREHIVVSLKAEG